MQRVPIEDIMIMTGREGLSETDICILDLGLLIPKDGSDGRKIAHPGRMIRLRAAHWAGDAISYPQVQHASAAFEFK